MSNTHRGIVTNKSSNLYAVHTGEQQILCTPSNKLFLAGDKTDPVAVGDTVTIHAGADGQGPIVSVDPRQTRLTRRAPGKKPREQVIVANADQLLIVTAASRPVPDLVMLDRYLISAEAAGIEPVIVFTKWDDEAERRDYVEPAAENYRAIGYTVIITSSVTHLGIDAVQASLQGKTSALVGMSGVGKSSLLNAVQPNLALRVSHVSDSHGEGRHTTTSPELFYLDDETILIDTPGIREFSLWDVPEDELIELFPEVVDYLGQCRFADCTHRDEPACAVQQAVKDGAMSPMRLRSYHKIRWPR